MISTDVVILGGGCVGLTLALALVEQGVRCAVVEQQSLEQALPELHCHKVTAINAASQAILTRLGVWQQLPQQRLCGYQSMYVWEKDSFASIEFDAASLQYPQLGHIVESQALRNSLLHCLQQHSDQVQLLFDAQLQQINHSEREVVISLADGSILISQLLVAADGARSAVRQKMAMPLTFWDYEHHAIVATVKTELAHQHCARQVFLPDGPLALLPLSNPNVPAEQAQQYCSIVWSTEPARAKALMAMDEQEFNQQLTVAFDHKLGLTELVSQRSAYPLTMRYARQWVDNRVALIGDAAHTIHPLAGLGMNLGLVDAACLAEQLAKLKQQQQDLGLTANLRAFERWRKSEAQSHIVLMEGFKRLFAGENPLLKLLRGTGLSLVDQLSPIKLQLIKQAMGIGGDLPELAKPLSRDPLAQASNN